MFLAHLRSSSAVPAPVSAVPVPAPVAPVSAVIPAPVAPVIVKAAPVSAVSVIEPVRIESVETLQPLRGSGRTGDFVHNTQKMDERFRNVSSGWTKRLNDPDDLSVMTFDQAIEHVSRAMGETSDIHTTYDELKPIATSEGFLIQDKRTGKTFQLSDDSLNQFSERLKIGRTLPRRLICGDDSDRQTLATVVENGLRKVSGKPVLLRIRDDRTVRAFLSQEYATIDHRWLLETLQRFIPGGLVSHFRSDDDCNNVWFNVLIPDSLRVETDSEYGGMISTGNGETGHNRLHTLPSVFRAICMNGCIWDQTEGTAFIDQVHRGEINLSVLADCIRDNLHRQIPLLTTGIDTMLQTRQLGAIGVESVQVIGSVLQCLDCSAITRQSADEIVKAYAEQRIENSRVTAFDVIQGMTKAAQTFGNQLQETTERAAGIAMSWNGDKWESVFSMAKSIDRKQLKKLFATSV